MEITTIFLILGAVMILFIAIPAIVIPLQNRKRRLEGDASLPQGGDNSDFSKYLREKYQEDKFADMEEFEGDRFQ